MDSIRNGEFRLMLNNRSKNMKKLFMVILSCIILITFSACEPTTNESSQNYETGEVYSDSSLDKPKIDNVEKSDSEYGMRFNMTLDEFISRYNDIVNEQEDNKFTRESMFLVKSDFEVLAQKPDTNGVMITAYISYIKHANSIEPNGYGFSLGVESATGKIRSVELLFTKTYWNKITETGHRKIMNRDIPYMYMAINPSLTYEEAHNIIANLVDVESKNYLYYYDSNYLYTMREDTVNKLDGFQVKACSDEVYNKYKPQN